MKKIQILLIEENRLLREGIFAMLKKQADMHFVGNVGSEENVLQFLGKTNPDIVLLDLNFGSQNSLQVVKLIKTNSEKTKIILINLIPIQADVFDFVQSGVSGFILKNAKVNEFVKTIHQVNDGRQVLPPDLTGSLFSQVINHKLTIVNPSEIVDAVDMTKREKQVMELIAEGFTNKEIAQKLHLSISTIKSHVHNILEKLMLNTRVEIAKHVHVSGHHISKSNLFDQEP